MVINLADCRQILSLRQGAEAWTFFLFVRVSQGESRLRNRPVRESLGGVICSGWGVTEEAGRHDCDRDTVTDGAITVLYR